MKVCAHRLQHGHLWVVLERRGSFYTRTRTGELVKGDTWRPSASSRVYCPSCATSWRTAAAYVVGLPDADSPATHAFTERELRIEQIISEHPLLAELTYLPLGISRPGRFLTDIAERLRLYGELSERQVVVAEGAIKSRVEYQAIVDRHRAQRALLGASAAPHGRVVTVGTVEDVWEIAVLDVDPPTTRWLMRVRSDLGYRFEVTIPASLRREHGTLIKGRRIEIEATLWPHRDEPTRATGSYPSQRARLLPDEEAR